MAIGRVVLVLVWLVGAHPAWAQGAYSGFYGGVHGGWGWGVSAGSADEAGSGGGPTLGLHAGYSHLPQPRWLMGLEAGADVGALGASDGPGLTLRSRVGWLLPGEKTLAFAALGAGAAASEASQGRITGWNAGLGMEHSVFDRFRLRLEWLLLSREQTTVEEVTPGGPVEVRTRVQRHGLRLGIGYRF